MSTFSYGIQDEDDTNEIIIAAIGLREFITVDEFAINHYRYIFHGGLVFPALTFPPTIRT